jgi:glycosyltransferase involved in cell wall biosynthesis
LVKSESLKSQKISTLRNVSSDEPRFPKGSYCGRYPVLPPTGGRIAQGGLRFQQQYKQGKPDKPLVTYITVVKNNTETLQRCMESVWNQIYDNIEYIVIDGASADGSLDLIKNNAGYIDYFVSEPDNGIYSAMNKALQVASGDLVNILNSDDWAEPDAAAKVANKYLETGFDFLGGAGKVYHTNGFAYEWLPRKIKLGNLFFGMPVAHQAVYATRDCYEITGLYDESYRAAADFKWVIKVFASGLEITLTNELLAHYSLDGISSNRELGLQERVRLIQEHFLSLTPEDARLLAEALHVTPVWHSSKLSSIHEPLYRIYDKYSHDRLLIKTMGEALLMQCAELEKRYQI